MCTTDEALATPLFFSPQDFGFITGDLGGNLQEWSDQLDSTSSDQPGAGPLEGEEIFTHSVFEHDPHRGWVTFQTPTKMIEVLQDTLAQITDNQEIYVNVRRLSGLRARGYSAEATESKTTLHMMEKLEQLGKGILSESWSHQEVLCPRCRTKLCSHEVTTAGLFGLQPPCSAPALTTTTGVRIQILLPISEFTGGNLYVHQSRPPGPTTFIPDIHAAFEAVAVDTDQLHCGIDNVTSGQRQWLELSLKPCSDYQEPDSRSPTGGLPTITQAIQPMEAIRVRKRWSEYQQQVSLQGSPPGTAEPAQRPSSGSQDEMSIKLEKDGLQMEDDPIQDSPNSLTRCISKQAYGHHDHSLNLSALLDEKMGKTGGRVENPNQKDELHPIPQLKIREAQCLAETLNTRIHILANTPGAWNRTLVPTTTTLCDLFIAYENSSFHSIRLAMGSSAGISYLTTSRMNPEATTRAAAATGATNEWPRKGAQPRLEPNPDEFGFHQCCKDALTYGQRQQQGGVLIRSPKKWSEDQATAAGEWMKLAIPKAQNTYCQQTLEEKSLPDGIFFAQATDRKKSHTLDDLRCEMAKKAGPDWQLTEESLNEDQFQEIQERFWEHIGSGNKTTYGSNIEGIYTANNAGSWDMRNLDSSLRKLPEDYEGITSPMTYLATIHSLFPNHTEDMNLMSLNLLVAGQPKIWYVLDPNDQSRFETWLKRVMPDYFMGRCINIIRHKNLLVDPREVRRQGISIQVIVQWPGDMVLTLPGAVHWGFGTGPSIAHAVNLTFFKQWIALGRREQECDCVSKLLWFDPLQIMERTQEVPQEKEPAVPHKDGDSCNCTSPKCYLLCHHLHCYNPRAGHATCIGIHQDTRLCGACGSEDPGAALHPSERDEAPCAGCSRNTTPHELINIPARHVRWTGPLPNRGSREEGNWYIPVRHGDRVLILMTIDEKWHYALAPAAWTPEGEGRPVPLSMNANLRILSDTSETISNANNSILAPTNSPDGGDPDSPSESVTESHILPTMNTQAGHVNLTDTPIKPGPRTEVTPDPASSSSPITTESHKESKIDPPAKKKRLMAALSESDDELDELDAELKKGADEAAGATNGNALREAHAEQDDKATATTAVKGKTPPDAQSEQDDKAAVMTAVRKDGKALQYASRQLQADAEVVSEAVRQWGPALQFAHPRLREEPDIIFKAARSDLAALQWADPNFTDHKGHMSELIRESGWALQYASARIANTWAIVARAVDQDPGAIRYASKGLQQDQEIRFIAGITDRTCWFWLTGSCHFGSRCVRLHEIGTMDCNRDRNTNWESSSQRKDTGRDQPPPRSESPAKTSQANSQMGDAMVAAFENGNLGTLEAIMDTPKRNGDRPQYLELSAKKDGSYATLLHKTICTAIAHQRDRHREKADRLFLIAHSLIRRGAKIGEEDEKGTDALWHMVTALDVIPDEWIEWAIDMGADPFKMPKDRSTAYDYHKTDIRSRSRLHDAMKQYYRKGWPFINLPAQEASLPDHIEIRLYEDGHSEYICTTCAFSSFRSENAVLSHTRSMKCEGQGHRGRRHNKRSKHKHHETPGPTQEMPTEEARQRQEPNRNATAGTSDTTQKDPKDMQGPARNAHSREVNKRQGPMDAGGAGISGAGSEAPHTPKESVDPQTVTSGSKTTPSPATAPIGPIQESGWQPCHDQFGRVYYYSHITKTSVWSCPDGVTLHPPTEKPIQQAHYPPTQPTNRMKEIQPMVHAPSGLPPVPLQSRSEAPKGPTGMVPEQPRRTVSDTSSISMEGARYPLPSLGQEKGEEQDKLQKRQWIAWLEPERGRPTPTLSLKAQWRQCFTQQKPALHANSYKKQEQEQPLGDQVFTTRESELEVPEGTGRNPEGQLEGDVNLDISPDSDGKDTKADQTTGRVSPKNTKTTRAAKRTKLDSGPTELPDKEGRQPGTGQSANQTHTGKARARSPAAQRSTSSSTVEECFRRQVHEVREIWKSTSLGEKDGESFTYSKTETLYRRVHHESSHSSAGVPEAGNEGDPHESTPPMGGHFTGAFSDMGTSSHQGGSGNPKTVSMRTALLRARRKRDLPQDTQRCAACYEYKTGPAVPIGTPFQCEQCQHKGICSYCHRWDHGLPGAQAEFRCTHCWRKAKLSTGNEAKTSTQAPRRPKCQECQESGPGWRYTNDGKFYCQDCWNTFLSTPARTRTSRDLDRRNQ